MRYLHKSEYARSETHRRRDVWTLTTLWIFGYARWSQRCPVAATYLSHRNTQEGPGLLGVSAGCHHRRGPRMGPALSPPSPCCMCLHDSGPRGSRRANPCEGLMPSLYGRSPPSLHNRLQTDCAPREACTERERPVTRARHMLGVAARPIRWPCVVEASRWG